MFGGRSILETRWGTTLGAGVWNESSFSLSRIRFTVSDPQRWYSGTSHSGRPQGTDFLEYIMPEKIFG